MEKKIGTANWMAEAYPDLVRGNDYIIESFIMGKVYVYDLEGNYVAIARADCFDNYRALNGRYIILDE